MHQKVKILFVSLFILATQINGFATTNFKLKGGKIADKGSGAVFIDSIKGLPITMNDSFGLEAVIIKLSHPSLAYITITLMAPDSSTYLLCNNLPGGLMDSTIFTDTGSISVLWAKAKVRGNFKPVAALKPLNQKKLNPNGKWRIIIRDYYGVLNAGTLTYWYLIFGNHPASNVKLDSSNLPILSINTKGATIVDNPKVGANFNLINNTNGRYNHLKDSNKYAGYCGIEIRGSSSNYMFPKKSYGVETRNISGVKTDTSLLGMPAENDWVLLANHTDKTFMRNYLSYKYSNQLGHYATRTRYVELVVNGVYEGVYILGEKIKQDKHRVNISKLTTKDTTGDALTGGYIVKIDKFTGSFVYYWVSKFKPADSTYGYKIYYQIHDPGTLQPQQEKYIKTYIEDSFETALKGLNFKDTTKGWRRYADENSFIDYFIINELSHNVDGYRLSTYMYKDKYSKGQGKLHLGPAWDYDIAWHNANYCDGDKFNTWAYKFPCSWDGFQIPFWWDRLMKDPVFTGKLNCRWKVQRRTILSDANIIKDMDSISSLLDTAQGRNFIQWPVLGTYIWPNTSYPPTYQAEVDTLKKWIKNRTKFLDKYMPGTCLADIDPPTVKLLGKDTTLLQVFTQYKDTGIYAFDKFDSFKVTIKKITNLDTAKLGIYTLKYIVSDKALNTVSITRIIKVIDTIPPTLTLKYGDSFMHQVPFLHSDSDVVIQDNYDSFSKIIINKKDSFIARNDSILKLGKYATYYTLTDASKNTSTFIKHFEVVDTIAPTIKLIGNPIVRLTQHDVYTDSGYIVSDNYYPTISLKLDTFSTLITTDSAGDFVINYQAKDSSNNISVSGDRKIHIDKSAGINELANQKDVISIYPNPVSNNYFYVQSDLKEIKVSIYDLLGKEICTFIGSSNGKYELPQSTSNGVYLVEINANGFTTKQKIMVLRGL
ncbi:MAG: CotH kinase family protein [Bacteroidetes bacterium]|nr:CotH kinase family protein [Bacteroidota bacterium]